MNGRHYSPRSVTIVATELTWILLTLAGAITVELVRHHASLRLNQAVQQVGFAMALYLISFYYCDLYNFTGAPLRRDLVSTVVRAFSVLAIVFGVIFLCTTWLAFGSATMFVHLSITIAFVLAVRTRIDAILARFGIVTKIVIVGTGPEARQLAQEILRRHEYGHEVCCFVESDGQTDPVQLRTANPGVRNVPVIASAQLPEFAREARIKRILVATADLGNALPVDDLLLCKTDGYEVEDGHTFYERLLGRIFIAGLNPQWLIFSDGFVRSGSARAVKRILDVVAATCLLVLTAPLCAVVALAIKLDDRGPALFRQKRVGRHGACFNLFKFRSMRVDAEAETGPTWAESNDVRVTRVGRCIRKLRIDEIPQAWNVLRGEMSFVGPRPERPEFVASLRAVVPYYDQRHAVHPGITGWAQVSLPYGATAEDARDKLEYDLYYLKNFSVLMDAFIMFRTIKIILFGWGSR
ncbi:MAG: sugar transferase [Candidatus Binatia bacterium]